ncbi:hypothetical protein I532_24935 [Brevibacillus borstelensis AK1]|uniref:Uncharacterized protein n=1 Tax=Brevibacillus borstelensis AK1 TaxID=1300222 RepID=M8DSN1_9BACL|nr:hypothetical protein [Brevibacillus borstelensis]EMT49946.1 hypothetical protein I532_24935 [Brevibacillus borstelensis AK1]
MKDWKDIEITGINKIDKVVAEFQVWAIEKVPYGKFKIKILETAKGGYIGLPNLAVKNIRDGTPDGTSGFGGTIEEALEDTIKYFLQTLEGRENLTENDFVWSDPHDF